MPVYLDKKSKKYYVSFYQKDWRGETKRILKRGFKTKREAQKFEREELLKTQGNLNMEFLTFVDMYLLDIKEKIKLTTYDMKLSVIYNRILPYFNVQRIGDIKTPDILKWHNKILGLKKVNGEKYSPVYIKTINNQLNAIFNHAVRFYGLQENPMTKAGSIGKKRNHEMNIWTKEEYLLFSRTMMDTPVAYYAFEMFYWCGLRMGELLALTKKDFDFINNTVKINKSLQRRSGENYVTTPKSEKSNRVIKIPQFLVEEIQEYISSIYKVNDKTLLFPVTKHYFHRNIKSGAKKAKIKKIRVHDLRHSHVSLLIDLGFSVVAIAERMGHESIDITYNYAHLFPSVQNQMAQKLQDLRG